MYYVQLYSPARTMFADWTYEFQPMVHTARPVLPVNPSSVAAKKRLDIMRFVVLPRVTSRLSPFAYVTNI